MRNKTVIVTGAASGIGLATARRFSTDPKYTRIVAVDKDAEIYSLFQGNDYPNVHPIKLDLTDREGTSQFIQDVAESGGLDVIVNAAGIMVQGSGNHNENSAVKLQTLTNFVAPLDIMMAAYKHMRCGTIINVTSSKYMFPDLYHLDYQWDKEMLSRVTRGTAKNIWREYGIRLVDVQPGNTRTNIDHEEWTDGTPVAERQTVQSVANWWRQKFGGDPENVADVIYKIAEGKKGTTFYIGLDARIGKYAYNLSLLPGIFTAGVIRSNTLFLAGSTIVYKTAAQIKALRSAKPTE